MHPVLVRHLGLQPYQTSWQAMQHYTEQRTPDSADELWLLQHPPIFTQGLNGKAEHLLDPGSIPVLPVDRGGQVTYHGPGQIILYLLLDLRRLGLGVRQLVSQMEQAIISLLADYQITAVARQDAPGVYVDGAKLASLGLRVRHGRCYHGLALNVDMDLSPFARINPCGYQGLQVTQLRALGVDASIATLGEQLLDKLAAQLKLTCIPAPATPPFTDADHAPNQEALA